MSYYEAKKLRSQDRVTVKATGKTLTIQQVQVFPRTVIVLCEDGNTYRHREIL